MIFYGISLTEGLWESVIESRVRFRHLQTFLEVARQKSVVKAAGLLNVSQPAVTKTIRELEEALGVAVFERDGRGIKITRSGEIFLRHAGTAITALRQGIDSVASGNDGGVPIRVGALPTVSARIMPYAMSLFLKEETGSTIKILTGENAVLLEQLRLGELDLVVGRLAAPEKMTGFFFEHLYSEQVLFVVRAGHPLLGKGEDVFKRLARISGADADARLGHPPVRRALLHHQRRGDNPDPDRDRLGLVRPRLRAPKRRHLDHFGRRRRGRHGERRTGRAAGRHDGHARTGRPYHAHRHDDFAGLLDPAADDPRSGGPQGLALMF